jgi:predicted amidophosphoribosyltransferase
VFSSGVVSSSTLGGVDEASSFSAISEGFRTLLRSVFGERRSDRAAIERITADVLAADAIDDSRGRVCRKCGRALQEETDLEAVCVSCRTKRGVPEHLVALGAYSGGLGTLVAAAKYGRWPEALEVLGRRLGDVAKAEFVFSGSSPIFVPLLVPMPSPRLRRWHRGIDHALVLGRAMAQTTGWRCAPLLRRGWEPTQVGQSWSGRRRGGRRIKADWGTARRVAGSTIVLVDDVRTSGASLARASRCCRGLGAARVLAAVVAVRREGPENP